jgi:hypothetical protein
MPTRTNNRYRVVYRGFIQNLPLFGYSCLLVSLLASDLTSFRLTIPCGDKVQYDPQVLSVVQGHPVYNVKTLKDVPGNQLYLNYTLTTIMGMYSDFCLF